ncbi:hypothetical protein [Streptomyces chartreusis]
MRTVAIIVAAVVLATGTVVGVVHSLQDESTRPTDNPNASVVPYGNN